MEDDLVEEVIKYIRFLCSLFVVVDWDIRDYLLEWRIVYFFIYLLDIFGWEDGEIGWGVFFVLVISGKLIID